MSSTTAGSLKRMVPSAAMLTALIVRDGQMSLTQVPKSLEALQLAVDGNIEAGFTVPSPAGPMRAITGYVNEDGFNRGLPLGIVVKEREHERPLCGDMIIVGLDERTGETVGLTDADIVRIEQCADRFDMYQWSEYTFFAVLVFDFTKLPVRD